MILTLNIDTESSKGKAFLEFIKTLDFVTVETADEFVLTDEQTQILNERKENHINKISKSYTWEEVQEKIKNAQ